MKFIVSLLAAFGCATSAQAASFLCVSEIGQTMNSDGADYNLELQNYGGPEAELTFAKIKYKLSSPADLRGFESTSGFFYTLRISEEITKEKSGIIALNTFDGLERKFRSTQLFHCYTNKLDPREDRL